MKVKFLGGNVSFLVEVPCMSFHNIIRLGVLNLFCMATKTGYIYTEIRSSLLKILNPWCLIVCFLS